VNELQELALFNLIPIALWLTLLFLVCWIWWSKRLQDSLAYLVYLRERKVLFVSMLAGLAALRVVGAIVSLASGFGYVSSGQLLLTGLVGSVIGGVIVFLFGWLLLWRGPAHTPAPLVLDVPEHLTYSLGALDRAESERSRTTNPP
jgi:hypothetical protein